MPNNKIPNFHLHLVLKQKIKPITKKEIKIFYLKLVKLANKKKVECQLCLAMRSYTYFKAIQQHSQTLKT